MNTTAMECGCYASPDGRLTRCPNHNAQVELAMALAGDASEWPFHEERRDERRDEPGNRPNGAGT